VLIHPWTTAERSDPEWVPHQVTGTADQADLVKLGTTQLYLMSLDSALVWQLAIIEHKIDRHEGARGNGNVYWTSHWNDDYGDTRAGNAFDNHVTLRP